MITTIKGHRWITFKNGYTLSIANGFGSYSENHYRYKSKNKFIIRTKDCEIAILKDGYFTTKNVLGIENDVLGYVDKYELKEIKKKVRKYKVN